MIHSIVMATLMALATPAGGAANLADAAMKRDTAAVRSLLQQKVDVNAARQRRHAGIALGRSRR